MRNSLGTIISVTACLGMLLAVWGVYGWLTVGAYGMQGTVSQLITDRDTAQQKVAYSETLRSLLRDTAGERTQLANLGTLSAVDVVDRIRTIGTDAGVDGSIDTISPSTFDSRVANNAPALAVSVSASGAFSHLYHFLQLLETAPFPIMIDQVSLEHQAINTAQWTLRVRVLIYTENGQ